MYCGLVLHNSQAEHYRFITPARHPSQKAHTLLSPKQWEGRGDSKGAIEKVRSQISMPNPHTISQQTISERWAFTSPKAVWTPHTRHPPHTPAIYFTTVAAQLRRDGIAYQ